MTDNDPDTLDDVGEEADEEVEVVAADEALWNRYTDLATRSYGHPIPDLAHLQPYADTRVALRGGQVIAGGLGLLVPQYFGGRPVPAACMAAGCVAPEERGRHLTTRLLADRIRPLRDQGAVLATVWTTSSGYGHRLGWAAPAPAFTWTIPTEELRRSFPDTGYQISHGTSPQTPSLQQELAAGWNGPWQRPSWWQTWQADKHPQYATYRFHLPGHAPSGLLSVASGHDDTGQRQVVVHDFWARTGGDAAAMLAFLGRYNSRIPIVLFQRTGLPPTPVLLEQLHRIGSAAARHWHPWMIRILDLGEAIRRRGWPPSLNTAIPIEVADTPTAPPARYTLLIGDGQADLEPSSAPGRCTLTRRQFAAWYAGGYRTTTAAALAGVDGDQATIADLIRATSDREPWLPEHF
ncbi:GNAT family N-acetyltransferase [Actinomadura hibisca]|uniref:GNAT family N-acetyltransferase n=1 Tax=Actinomadura hibisca TaxID=68565 RepID=UPI000AE03073|nr:GNAT family N-acetyltransferase [Actinomadura hibisca]